MYVGGYTEKIDTKSAAESLISLMLSYLILTMNFHASPSRHVRPKIGWCFSGYIYHFTKVAYHPHISSSI